MPSITALDMLKHDDRLVWITAFHCSKLMRCIVASRVMPALLTSTSTGPELGLDRLDALGAGVEIADVELEDRDAGLAAETARAVCVVAAVIGRDLVARHSSSAIAIARPMPRVPPVTTATLAMVSSLDVSRLSPRADHARPCMS